MRPATKLEEIFTTVYKTNLWGDNFSVSGPGSNLEQTETIRNKIIDLINNHKIKTIIDAPCGDVFWMKEVLKEVSENIRLYVGIDIVENLVQENKIKYGSDRIEFRKLDLTLEIVPISDLIICRDCFLHLSNRNIYRILRNFKLSGGKYLLASSYTNHENVNVFKYNVHGRAVNLEKWPFKINSKLEVFNENYLGQNGEFRDKSLIFLELNSIKLNEIFFMILINEIVFLPQYVINYLFTRGLRVIKKMFLKFIK